MTPLTDNPLISQSILSDMKEREAFGHKKYNSFVTVYNNRNLLQETYEEALDFAVYLKGHLLRLEKAPEVPSVWQEVIKDFEEFTRCGTVCTSPALREVYWNCINNLAIIKEHLLVQSQEIL